MASSTPPSNASPDSTLTEKKPPSPSQSSPSSSPAATTPTKAAPKKSSTKSKSGFNLFACFPCIGGSSSAAFEEKPLAPPPPPPAAASSGPTATTSTAKVAANGGELSEKTEAVSSSRGGAESEAKEEEVLVPVSDKTLEEEAALANSNPDGAVLSDADTEGVTSAAVMPPGKRGKRRSGGGKGTEGIITSVEEPGVARTGVLLMGAGGSPTDESEDESEDDESEEDEEQSLIARGGVGIPIGEDGLPHPLLEPLTHEMTGRKCLVLDLDETLVHSSFKQMVHQADYVVPVEIENQYHNVYVIKRPGVDHFLKAMGEIYEVVIFTASLSKYADPVLDQLDTGRVVQHRLFRESCYNNKGSYVKDLSQLGRPMSECIIIDNSPASYVFHPNNAIPTSSWFNDPHDTELTDMIPFLADVALVDDVRSVLDQTIYA